MSDRPPLHYPYSQIRISGIDPDGHEMVYERELKWNEGDSSASDKTYNVNHYTGTRKEARYLADHIERHLKRKAGIWESRISRGLEPKAMTSGKSGKAAQRYVKEELAKAAAQKWREGARDRAEENQIKEALRKEERRRKKSELASGKSPTTKGR